MIRLIEGDARERLTELPDACVHCCVTSPPYFGLRDYGVDGQIGLEPSPAEYVAELVSVFREVRRVLRDDGTLWLNIGDSYNSQPGQRKVTDKIGTKQATNAGSNDVGSRNCPGMKPKDLIGIPWMLAFALRADGWWLRQDIIWSKPNPMPESVTDRCTKAHEYLFMLSKSACYHYDLDAIREPMSRSSIDRLSQDIEAQRGSNRVLGKTNGTMKAVGRIDKQRGHSRRHAGFNDRWDAMTKAEQCTGFRNKRSVWEIATASFNEAHFATFPPALIEPCILAGCPIGGTVLDPFAGAGTTGLVADRLQRSAILIELKAKYADMTRRRIVDDAGLFAQFAD